MVLSSPRLDVALYTNIMAIAIMHKIGSRTVVTVATAGFHSVVSIDAICCIATGNSKAVNKSPITNVVMVLSSPFRALNQFFNFSNNFPQHDG
jgi:uncharacterized membrane protein